MRRLALIWAVWLSLDACTAPVGPVAAIEVPSGALPVGQPVALDGRASRSGSGAPLAYAWRLTSAPSGSEAWLRQAGAAVTTLVPDLVGEYEVELVVGDGLLTASARASVSVACGAAAPVVTIDPVPATRGVGAPVSLSAQVSDADTGAPCSLPQAIGVAWSLVEVPAGSRAELVGAEGLTPSFVPDVGGTYRVTAVATDPTGRTGHASVDVTVSACGARAPEIKALSASPAAVGAPVQLTAQAADPDEESGCGVGARLAYAWRLVALPAGSRARLNDPGLVAPSFVPDVAGAYEAELTVTDDTGRVATGRLQVESSACGSNPPVVDAISTAGASLGRPVRLSAQVDDADRSCGRAVVLSWAWRLTALPAGSRVRLVDGARADAEFVPDVPGRYAGELVLSDETGRSDTERFSVDVGPCGSGVPVIESTLATPALLGAPVRLSVEARDPDDACGPGDRLAFAWSLARLPAGSTASLAASDTAAPWFTPDVAGTYVAEVVVRDAAGHAARSAHAVDVAACGASAPVIGAVEASAARLGDPVRLSVTATDPDEACGRGGTLSYGWSMRAQPPGSQAGLSDPTIAAPWFAPDLEGRYELEVVVGDGSGRFAVGSAMVEVGPCGANPPTITALSATAATIDQPVVLSATASDPDAVCSGAPAALAWSWRFVALPLGSVAAFDDAARPVPSFVPDEAGDYVVELTVIDATGRAATRRMTVEVSACGGQAPVVTAVVPSTVAPGVGQAVSLRAVVEDEDASATCGLAESHGLSWRLVGLPSGSRARVAPPDALSPSLTPDVAGAYVVEVVATDRSGRASAPVRLALEASPCGANAPTVALAGPTQANVGAPVRVRATVADADDDPAGCALAQGHAVAWAFAALPPGSRARLEATAGLDPWFVPDVAGDYVVRAQAIDAGGLRSLPATATVRVSACGGRAPVVTAQAEPSAPSALQAVRLVATASDADDEPGCALGETFRYAWALTSLPAGSGAVLAGAASSTPWFVPDVAGRYAARVVVTDSTGRSASADVALEAGGCGLAAPVVVARASDVAPAAGSVVALAASVTDADAAAPCSLAQSFAYAWSFLEMPAGSRARLLGATTEAASVVPDLPGRYVAQVRVVDAAGKQGRATVSFDATSCGLAAPQAALAGTSQLGVGQRAIVAGTAADADTDAACGRAEAFRWRWSFAALPAGSAAVLTGAPTPEASFVPDVPGVYAVRGVVEDAAGHTSEPAVHAVTVSACGAAVPVAQFAVLGTARVGGLVALESSSSDADEAAPCAQPALLAHAWTFAALPEGSRAVLSGSTARLASFVPDVAGTYRVRLVTTDASGRAGAAERDLLVAACGAHAPVAQFTSSPATAAPSLPVTLSATVVDADNDVGCLAPGGRPQWFSYDWRLVAQPPGSRALLTSAVAASPSFTPDVPGDYVVRLVATDASGLASVPVERSVTVGACGTGVPVVAATASPANVALGQQAALAATYADADESPACVAVTGAPGAVRYDWRLAQAPAGSRAALTGAATSTPGIMPDVAGQYVATVTVTDATGRTGEASATLVANGCGGAAPGGAPALATGQTLSVGRSVLVQSNATDADNAAPCAPGQALSYSWSLVEAPAGSRATLAPAQAQDASFTPDVAGRYVASVRVTDSTGRAATLAPVVVTVGACGGAAPVPVIRMTSPSTTGASAALTVDPVLSCRVQLDASSSQDADAACGLPQGPAALAYRWEQVGAPAGSTQALSSSTQAAPWSDLDADGAYEYRLWVSDGTYTSAQPATARIVHRGFKITGVSPALSCAGSTVSNVVLTAGGQGFLRLTATNTLPSVTISNGATFSSRTLSGCSAAGMPAGVESCTTLTLAVSNASTAGNYTVTVTNPVQDGCSGQAVFSIAESPRVSTISPTKVCAADPAVPSAVTLGVAGQNFVANTRFSLGTAAASLASIGSTTSASVAFPLPATPGLYEVSASNGASCGGIPPFPSLNVVAQPIAYSVDPPVLYNGITTLATVYASGLGAANPPTAVLIRPAGSTADPTSLTFTYDGGSVFTQGRVQVVVPAGLSAGDWEVFITDSNTCASKAVRALRITSSLGLALGSIDPPFGGSTVATAVDLRITSPLPAGKEAFTSGQPRVYLNPSAGGGQALALNTVTVVNAGLANAVVKSGLAAGTYDVIAVNPSGQVGVLRNAFRVLSVPPPVIDAIVPGSVPAGSAATITVRGSGFASPAARLDCVGSAGNAFSVAAGVSASTATTVTTTAPPLTAGDLCVYVVTNADGSYAEFSALGVTSPSLNLGAFAPNTSLITARRSPATTYGRPTRTARFLYAIGGDNGAIGAGNVLSSIEAASLDRYGTLGPWRTLPVSLPAGRTFTTAVTIGKFIYLPGGDLGGGPTNTVLRAKILDPGEAPTITDAALGFAPGGLGTGAWSYRVAAVMQASDLENPSGEGLPSDAFIVNVPTGLPSTVTPLLSWTAVPGAASYRIYRSPAANAASGTERLAATVAAPTTSWTDTGVAAAGASARSLGDLGAWASLGNMVVARSAAGIAYAVDPTDARRSYLYAMAGLSSPGVADASYEYLPITTNPATGAHSLGSWTRVTSTGLAARWQVGVFTVTDVITSRITPGDTWLHLGTGLTGGGASSNNVDAARVQAGGALSAFTAGRSPTNYNGYGYASAADQLFIFGGSGGPATGGRSTVLGATPPATGNWNAGIGLNVARQYQGSVVESARIFQVGGASSAGVTNTVESVVW